MAPESSMANGKSPVAAVRSGIDARSGIPVESNGVSTIQVYSRVHSRRKPNTNRRNQAVAHRPERNRNGVCVC